jgi:hypothetical protein
MVADRLMRLGFLLRKHRAVDLLFLLTHLSLDPSRGLAVVSPYRRVRNPQARQTAERLRGDLKRRLRRA